jgi:hypothetical protein
VSTRADASSPSSGAPSASAQESAQNTRSPAASTCRARTCVPSIPRARSDRRRTVAPPACRVGEVAASLDERPRRLLAALVEHRLAHELDLHGALDALHGPHEHVLGVVVGGWPRVRCDHVLAVARPIVSAPRTRDPRLVPPAMPRDETVCLRRPPGALRIDVNGRWRIEQRLHHPPRLLDAVLAREARRVSDDGRVQQHLVRSRALTPHLGEFDVEPDRPRPSRRPGGRRERSGHRSTDRA